MPKTKESTEVMPQNLSFEAKLTKSVRARARRNAAVIADTPPETQEMLPVIDTNKQEEITAAIKSRILARMQLDHLDEAHVDLGLDTDGYRDMQPDKKKILVNHVEAHARSAIEFYVEMYIDALSGTREQRNDLKLKMMGQYRRADAADKEFNLSEEFKDEAKLDAAVGVLHRYVHAWSEQLPREEINFTTSEGKIVSGGKLVDYFIGDVLKDAYLYAFHELGIEFDRNEASQGAFR